MSNEIVKDDFLKTLLCIADTRLAESGGNLQSTYCVAHDHLFPLYENELGDPSSIMTSPYKFTLMHTENQISDGAEAALRKMNYNAREDIYNSFLSFLKIRGQKIQWLGNASCG
jgi:O-glycosyl hydrolase